MTEQNKRLIELMKQTGTVDEKTLQEKLKQLYYSEGTSPITDEEYDELFGSKDYVGYTVDEQSGPWEVLEHKIAMGSLEKLKTWGQAQNWLKDKKDVFWQPKLDGLSIELVYEFGILKHAILRGGGDKGEDILKNAEKFTGVLPTINTNNSYVSVRGEVIIAQSKFDELCKISQDAYKNRRNCIPGICRRYDGQYAEFLSFYAYDIIQKYNEVEGMKEYAMYGTKLLDLYEYGFKLPFSNTQMTEQEYKQYGDIRDTAEAFQMDGLVIKTNDLKHQIALKFEPKGELTTVTGYSWEIGSTGKYVPAIWFEPVTVGGSRLAKAAVGSFQGYLDLNAPIGSKVEVRKMGDVIPKVTKVVSRPTDTNTGETLQLEIPDKCPHCGSTLERQGADLYCTNNECPIKQMSKATAIYWGTYLKGVTDGWVKQLIENGKLKKYYELPFVKAEDIAELDGYSLNKANKIIENMKIKFSEMLQTNDVKWFLSMLPIPTVAGKAIEKLASLFHNFVEFESWLKEWSVERQKQLVDILGNAKGNKAYDYISENNEGILQLLNNVKIIGE